MRAINLMADTAISLGYSEGFDGRPTLPGSLVYTVGTGAPAGGTLVPAGLVTNGKDGWGSSLGFCNYSSSNWNGWSTPLFAILSPGTDQAYQTSCNDAFSGLRNGDDLVRIVTAADWRASAAKGKTDGYKPPLNLLSDLNTVTPSSKGEVRLVLETKEVYINPLGLPGSGNWQLISGAISGGSSGKFVKRDGRGMRKWSDGGIAASCQGYLQGGSGYAYTGDIGDGLYWINPAGTPYGVYCDMTTEMGGHTFYTDLVAYWPMDEAFGNYAYDLLGTHDFSLNSTPTTGIISPIGKQITGRNPVSIPEIVAANPNQVTISAWLDNGTFTAAQMPFGFYQWDVETASNGVGFNTGNSEIYGATRSTGRHHYVFVFDRRPSTVSNFAMDERIYIDGVRQPLALLYGTQPYAPSRVWSSVLNFGGWGGNDDTQYWVSNSIYDDVAIWKRALTDSEVSVLYNSRMSFGGMLTKQAGFVKTSGVWAGYDGGALASCQAYQLAGARENGLYLINPSAPYTVFCDQTTDGGGWTLVMKQAAGDGATLQGDTVYWSMGTTLNDTAAYQNLNDGNFVSRAFATMTASAYRLQASNEATRQFYNRSSSTPQVAFSDSARTSYADPYGFPGTVVNWFIRTTTYPNGQAITAARFGFNFTENLMCGARWGWAANQDLQGSGNDATHDSCGGLGAYGSQYGMGGMNYNKGAWQPATLYLWAR
ncbi:fibrinogen-like YCDxxxxGGGW domain-containing protein [Cupriavidus sp. TMH.W2]|uniref:fibrinogen-like YCDxxxxGGGW domain-containing protein n=1 Tax=Cupriavidus sp. TMH.W2 TaxID=3434465 RepID=UPI003D788B1E